MSLRKGQPQSVLRSWYAVGGLEQGFGCYFADSIYRRLIPSAVNATSFNTVHGIVCSRLFSFTYLLIWHLYWTAVQFQVKEWPWLESVHILSLCVCSLLCLPHLDPTPKEYNKTSSNTGHWHSGIAIPRTDSSNSVLLGAELFLEYMEFKCKFILFLWQTKRNALYSKDSIFYSVGIEQILFFSMVVGSQQTKQKQRNKKQNNNYNNKKPINLTL